MPYCCSNSSNVVNGVLIRALPKDLPDFFDIDIAGLKIGDNITVETLLNDKFSILHPETTVVVQVKTARAAIVIDEPDEELEGEEEVEAGAEGATEAAAEEAAGESKE